MLAGLEVQYYLGEEPAKIYCRAFNDSVSAKSESYVNYGVLAEFAEALKSRDPSGKESLKFGAESSTSSFIAIDVTPLDIRGRVLIVVGLATGDYERHRSTATVRFESDPVSVDRFASELLLAISKNEGEAVLEGIC